MKKLLFTLLFLQGMLFAQSPMVQATYGVNYTSIDSTAQTGISSFVEGFVNFDRDSTFAIVTGLGIGYSSLSQEVGESVREVQANLYFGFSDNKHFSGGLFGNYQHSVEAIGIGGWMQIQVPIGDHVYIGGRGKLGANLTPSYTDNSALLNMSALVGYRF